jgi:hypothetical protein
MKPIINFFREMTGLEPTEDQKELLHKAVTIKEQGNRKYNKIIISAGRQSGKTLCSAIIVLWFVFEYDKPLKILLISAQDNILYLHIREVFKKHPELVEQLTERSKLAADLIPLHGFETINGTMVFVKGATEKQILGIPADIVVIDEACRVNNNIILECLGNITGDISKFILLSTPDIDTSLMVKWIKEENKDFRIFTWSSEGLAWHNKEIEDIKKKEYTKEMYATQVLGRPKLDVERSFFPHKHIDACILDVEPIREGGQDSWLEAGIDLGYNNTVLVIRERIGTTKKKVLFIKQWQKKPIEEVAPEIAKLLDSYNPKYTKVDSKAGMGVPVKGQIEKYTRKHIDYIDASIKVADENGEWTSHKEQMMGQLLRTIREHQIIIPICFVELITQLRKYRRNMQIGDDIVDALALACYNPIVPLGAGKSGRAYFPISNNHNHNKYNTMGFKVK